jgi:hypothetical protein
MMVGYQFTNQGIERMTAQSHAILLRQDQWVIRQVFTHGRTRQIVMEKMGKKRDS